MYSFVTDPEIVQATCSEAAVIRLTILKEDMPREFDAAAKELASALWEQRMEPQGPIFAHHFRRMPDAFDFQIGYPVEARVKPSGRVRSGQLPGGRAARAIHEGPYSELGEAWREFSEWIDKAGHAPKENFWLVCERGPGNLIMNGVYRTHLYRPLSSEA